MTGQSIRRSIIIAGLVRLSAGLLGIAGPSDAAQALSLKRWDYALTRDGLGAPQAVLARLQGREGALFLSCSRAAAESESSSVVTFAATVSHRQLLGASEAKTRSTVYWFDDEGPQVSKWIYRGHSGQMADPDHVRSFIQNLNTSQRLTVELSNYRYEDRVAEFRLEPDETKAVMNRFEKDCRDLAARGA